MFSQSAADWNSKGKEKENNNSGLIRFPNPFWETRGLSLSQAVQKAGPEKPELFQHENIKGKNEGSHPSRDQKDSSLLSF